MANGTGIRRKKSRGPVTSFDVARLAGVTQATVSRAINRPEVVAPETRQKIEQAMTSLNYRPSAAARGLARGKNGVVGLMTLTEAYTSHIFGSIVEGISSVLTEQDYVLSIAPFTALSTIEDLEKSPMIRQHTCDGLILKVDWTDAKTIRFLNRLTLPYILVNPGIVQKHDCIVPDDQFAAELAVNYLVSKGHRRIAY